MLRALVLSLCLLPTLSPGMASARSWCAQPLFVHEWGVQAFDSSGAPQSPTAIPSWFHRTGPAPAPVASPVRHMQPDQGVRFLPVLHFYADGAQSIPVGIEVGFTLGEASVWYPQVDVRRRAAQANSPAAQQARAQLVQARSARQPFAPGQSIGPDPTRQLQWDHLTLTPAPATTPHRPGSRAIRDLRAVDGLWVNGAAESERFVFYEANTTERVAIRVTRGDEWAEGRRHLILHNDGSHPVHDVFLTHRERGHDYAIYAPQIPAGRSAGFILEDHAVSRSDRAAQTRGRLRTQLQERLPRQVTEDCVMMRDPAVPMESTQGHRLTSQEIDVIDSVWGATFFDRRGTTIVYREDTAHLDEVMPLSIYTNMHSFTVLNRAGLVVWNEVQLP